MEPSLSSSPSIGDEEDMEQTMRGSEQSIEEKKNPASSEQTLPDRLCRICYGPEEASGADPILLLGCTCKGDIGYGHQSCLKKWFRERFRHNGFRRNGNLDCEVCRSPLGARLKAIIRSFITAEVIQHSPQLLLLLRVPPNDLDRLQVPLDTPGFYQLPSETQRSLEASIERLAQEQRRAQSRRREAFETAQLQSNSAADREPSEAVLQHEDGDSLNTQLRFEDMLLHEFLELSEFNVTGPFVRMFGPHVVRMFDEHCHPHIYRFDSRTDGEENSVRRTGRRIVYAEGPVVRVPILRPEDRVHPRSVEDLLDEVVRQAVPVVDLYGEDLILHPNFRESSSREMDEPFPVRDNADDIPIATPMLINPSSEGGDPVLAEAASPTDSIRSREYTYGQFQMFKLLQ